MSLPSLVVSAMLAPSTAWAGTAGAAGFDWSSAGIAVAALSGLVIVAIAVVSGVRHGKSQIRRNSK